VFLLTPPATGSGSHENGRPFKVRAMEKEVQIRSMHEQGCRRKREFCAQSELTVAACSSSAPARAVSSVSFPTAA
jgi:hypothetical protein